MVSLPQDPRTSMQVGNNVDAGQKGVGISSVGNINASGIITATSFVGDFTGNIVSNTNISGNVDLNADIDVDGHTNLDNVSIAGVTTFASATVFCNGNLDINADIDVDGHTNLDNLNVSGVSTFSGRVEGAELIMFYHFYTPIWQTYHLQGLIMVQHLISFNRSIIFCSCWSVVGTVKCRI